MGNDLLLTPTQENDEFNNAIMLKLADLKCSKGCGLATSV